MKVFSQVCFLATLLCTLSCHQNKKENESSYYYPANRFYTGSHLSRYYISANLKATDKKDSLQLGVTLRGLYATSDSFSVHIHLKDTTQPFGYSGNPVIDFGFFNQLAYTHTVNIKSFDYDYFINHFQGYLVVHDPSNIQNDTTTLLIYGKTGYVY